MLHLDRSKAERQLGWRPSLTFAEALSMTIDWYRDFLRGENARAQCLEQIARCAKVERELPLAPATKKGVTPV